MVVQATYVKDQILVESSDEALQLVNDQAFGAKEKSGKITLSHIEALYLVHKKKLIVVDGKGKELDVTTFEKKVTKTQSNFFARYKVFADLRTRGYVVKTALKFGADFRVYDRGIKPGEDHARWIVYAVPEAMGMTWHEFSAKNRVAHSTKKRLMIGVVDDEGDVTYYEIKWQRP